MVPALAAFNIGVEIGQVAIVSIVVPALILLDRLFAADRTKPVRARPSLVYALLGADHRARQLLAGDAGFRELMRAQSPSISSRPSACSAQGIHNQSPFCVSHSNASCRRWKRHETRAEHSRCRAARCRTMPSAAGETAMESGRPPFSASLTIKILASQANGIAIDCGDPRRRAEGLRLPPPYSAPASADR